MHDSHLMGTFLLPGIPVLPCSHQVLILTFSFYAPNSISIRHFLGGIPFNHSSADSYGTRTWPHGSLQRILSIAMYFIVDWMGCGILLTLLEWGGVQVCISDYAYWKWTLTYPTSFCNAVVVRFITKSAFVVNLQWRWQWIRGWIHPSYVFSILQHPIWITSFPIRLRCVLQNRGIYCKFFGDLSVSNLCGCK